MKNTKKITDDLTWIGVNDRRLTLFENVFPIPKGVSYNSYLLKDEKTVLFDTVDKDASYQFLENLEYELAGKLLDYIVVNHMEPDHCATLGEIIFRYPNVKIVCNSKTKDMINQFFDLDIESKSMIIKEGDTLNTGKHTLTFVMAPMVHWPEAMVTYDITDKILFSADAFGTFGALSGNIFADEVEFETNWIEEARRYYTNIVGKYGTQVQALLKKASTLDIDMICPLHGPIWRYNTTWFIDKYQKWSSYEPEENAVLILSGSIYGHTENAAEILASKLADKGIKNIVLYDVSKIHSSYLVAEAFRCSHIVIASASYNAGIFCNMETVLSHFKAHNLQNKKIAIIENGSWAPCACNLIEKAISEMKNMEIIQPTITVKSSLKKSQEADLDLLAENIFESMPKENLDINPMFKINYGLYLLTAKGEKDNGCIINAVNQITDNPRRITISVNKTNYTHDIIHETKEFNISVLTTKTPYKVFQKFGFYSGKDTDKFENCKMVKRSKNGIYYLDKFSNAFISAKVIAETDYGTHMLYTADVTEAVVLSNEPSVTYSYYLENIKPAPPKIAPHIEGFICKICGYIYEGKELPKDFICPLCKHGVEDFEKLNPQ